MHIIFVQIEIIDNFWRSHCIWLPIPHQRLETTPIDEFSCLSIQNQRSFLSEFKCILEKIEIFYTTYSVCRFKFCKFYLEYVSQKLVYNIFRAHWNVLHIFCTSYSIHPFKFWNSVFKFVISHPKIKKIDLWFFVRFGIFILKFNQPFSILKLWFGICSKRPIKLIYMNFLSDWRDNLSTVLSYTFFFIWVWHDLSKQSIIFLLSTIVSSQFFTELETKKN